ncbi:hypothetical protein ABIF65_000249 [Bradyrhizobium japonicum]|nr:hypothetical protein [Bradyrhizobium japonicum]MCP1776972.1 hypothetical protein [Bradyrhizobium japonicum]MCP1856456.1 hypothetical protein [Bradyrhizobium japonicum]MCP1887273.1 hypothetical protein [Bradyrhizobium japonicum]MCP1960028.1 hypothetical protein [Bradyrhizobium japonicum]
MDRPTQILLALIASGLWANALWSIGPLPAHAQAHANPGSAEYYLSRIDNNLGLILDGRCANHKIC